MKDGLHRQPHDYAEVQRPYVIRGVWYALDESRDLGKIALGKQTEDKRKYQHSYHFVENHEKSHDKRHVGRTLYHREKQWYDDYRETVGDYCIYGHGGNASTKFLGNHGSRGCCWANDNDKYTFPHNLNIGRRKVYYDEDYECR